MAETVRSELPNLWRSMNEPRACRHVYQICPQTKGRFKRQRCYALVDRCERAGSATRLPPLALARHPTTVRHGRFRRMGGALEAAVERIATAALGPALHQRIDCC